MVDHAEEPLELPEELSTGRLLRRALSVIALLVVVGLIGASGVILERRVRGVEVIA